MKELASAVEGGETATAVRLLGQVGELYRYPASPEEAEALLRAAGAATRARDPAVQTAALRAVGRTGAAAGASYVEPFLRSVNVEGGDQPVVLAAVEAAGRLSPPALVPPLLKLAQKSPNITLAAESFVALGRYRDAPVELRKHVAGKVLEVCEYVSRRQARWRRLRASGLRALQQLMGRKLNSVQMFTDWWRLAKTRKDPFQ